MYVRSYLPTYLSMSPIYLNNLPTFISASAYLHTYPPSYLSDSMPACTSVCMPTHPPTQPPTHLSTYLLYLPTLPIRNIPSLSYSAQPIQIYHTLPILERRRGRVVRGARLWCRKSPYRVSSRLGCAMRRLENSLCQPSRKWVPFSN